MSYFAKASRTGVEKVAVAIASTRRRSALQGVQGRDAFACGAAVRVDASCRPEGCKGDVCSRLPQRSRALVCGPLQLSASKGMRNAGLLGRSLHRGPHLATPKIASDQ